MSSTCYENKLVRDGTSQQMRLVKALLPDYVSVDERSIQELKDFVRDFARQIRYFKSNGDKPVKGEDDWFSFFNQSVSEEQRTQPHYALFQAFLELFRVAQNDMNTLTKRHLDFYYKEVLQLREKDPIPDQAFMIFELARHVSDTGHLIRKGTRLKAGKDSLGNNVFYTVSQDLVVNKAAVSEIKGLFKDTLDSGRLFRSPVLKSGDGQGGDFEGDTLSWLPFGDVERVPADVGFAFSSPILHLAEGTRKVRVTITFTTPFSPDYTALPATELDEAIRVFFSGEEEWISPLPQSEGLTEEEFKAVVDKRVLAFINTAGTAEEIAGLEPANGPVYDSPKSGTGDQRKGYDIGIKVAQAILATREKLTDKQFQRVEQLLDVKGLGPDKLNDLRYTHAAEANFFTEFNSDTNGNLTLTIERTLTRDQAAVVGYNQEVLSDPFETMLPTVKILLNSPAPEQGPYRYDLFSTLKVKAAEIAVDVAEVKNLVVQNDQTVMDPTKTILPFGIVPVLGSNFHIGSQEVFQKKLDELSINIDWYGLPEGADLIEISGEVLAGDTGIEDAKVECVSTGESVLTDENGNYTIEAPSNGVLRFTINCEETLKEVGNRTTINAKEGEEDELGLNLLADLIEISGKVVDTDNTELGGVKVECVSTGESVLTDQNGNYTIEAPSNGVLRFTINGEETLKEVGNRTTINAKEGEEDELGLNLFGFDYHYKDYINPRTNTSFKTNVSILDKKQWVSLQQNTNLFSGNDNEKLDALRKITISDTTTLQTVARDPALQEIESLDTNSQKGFIRFELAGQDFGHKDFQPSFTRKVLEGVNKGNADILLPKEPYTPSITGISLDYKSKVTIEGDALEQFFHVTPFGAAERKITDVEADAVFLFSQHTDAGELYIGFENLTTPQNLSLLVQVLEGSENPRVTKPDINWSYLTSDGWTPFEQADILSDTTNGLVTSGIINFSISKNATNQNTTLNKGLHWLRASIAAPADTDGYNPVEAIPNFLDVLTQVVIASFEDNANDPDFLAQALPANSISKFEFSDSAINSISQPFSSFGGAVKEQKNLFYRRVSERLRHKQRAIAIWDYERLILQQFPSVYKVKCLNHTRFENRLLDENGRPANFSEVAPGHVSIIVVSNVSNRNGVDLIRPLTSVNVLAEIASFLQDLSASSIQLHVQNPIYEEIKVGFKVKFRQGFDIGFYKRQLEDEIKAFLSPWAYDESPDIVFGGRLHQSRIIDFIDERPYVDYVTCFKMYHPVRMGTITAEEMEEVEALTSASILCSTGTVTAYGDHLIEVLEIEDNCDQCDDNVIDPPPPMLSADTCEGEKDIPVEDDITDDIPYQFKRPNTSLCPEPTDTIDCPELCVSKLSDPDNATAFNIIQLHGADQIELQDVNTTYLLPLSSYRKINLKVKEVREDRVVIFYGDLSAYTTYDRLEIATEDFGVFRTYIIQEPVIYSDEFNTSEVRLEEGHEVQETHRVNIYKITCNQFPRVYLPKVDEDRYVAGVFINIQLVTAEGYLTVVNRSEMEGNDRLSLDKAVDNGLLSEITLGGNLRSIRLEAQHFDSADDHNDYGWEVVDQDKNYFKENLDNNCVNDWDDEAVDLSLLNSKLKNAEDGTWFHPINDQLMFAQTNVAYLLPTASCRIANVVIAEVIDAHTIKVAGDYSRYLFDYAENIFEDAADRSVYTVDQATNIPEYDEATDQTTIRFTEVSGKPLEVGDHLNFYSGSSNDFDEIRLPKVTASMVGASCHRLRIQLITNDGQRVRILPFHDDVNGSDQLQKKDSGTSEMEILLGDTAGDGYVFSVELIAGYFESRQGYREYGWRVIALNENYYREAIENEPSSDWDNRCAEREECYLKDPEDTEHFEVITNGDEAQLYFKEVNRTYLLPISSYRKVNLQLRQVGNDFVQVAGDVSNYGKYDRVEAADRVSANFETFIIQDAVSYDAQTNTSTIPIRTHHGIAEGSRLNIYSVTCSQFSSMYLPEVDQQMVDEGAWLKIQRVTAERQAVALNRWEGSKNGRLKDLNGGQLGAERCIMLDKDRYSVRLEARKFPDKNGLSDFGWEVVEEDKNYYIACLENRHFIYWDDKEEALSRLESKVKNADDGSWFEVNSHKLSVKQTGFTYLLPTASCRLMDVVVEEVVDAHTIKVSGDYSGYLFDYAENIFEDATDRSVYTVDQENDLPAYDLANDQTTIRITATNGKAVVEGDHLNFYSGISDEFDDVYLPEVTDAMVGETCERLRIQVVTNGGEQVNIRRATGKGRLQLLDSDVTKEDLIVLSGDGTQKTISIELIAAYFGDDENERHGNSDYSEYGWKVISENENYYREAIENESMPDWDNRCAEREECYLKDPEDTEHFEVITNGDEAQLYFKEVNRTYLLPISSYRKVNLQLRQVGNDFVQVAGDVSNYGKYDRVEAADHVSSNFETFIIQDAVSYDAQTNTSTIPIQTHHGIAEGSRLNIYSVTCSQFSSVYLPEVDQQMVDEGAWLQVQLVTAERQTVKLKWFTSDIDGDHMNDFHAAHGDWNELKKVTLDRHRFSVRLKAKRFNYGARYHAFGWDIVEEDKNYYIACLENRHFIYWDDKEQALGRLESKVKNADDGSWFKSDDSKLSFKRTNVAYLISTASCRLMNAVVDEVNFAEKTITVIGEYHEYRFDRVESIFEDPANRLVYTVDQEANPPTFENGKTTITVTDSDMDEHAFNELTHLNFYKGASDEFEDIYLPEVDESMVESCTRLRIQLVTNGGEKVSIRRWENPRKGRLQKLDRDDTTEDRIDLSGVGDQAVYAIELIAMDFGEKNNFSSYGWKVISENENYYREAIESGEVLDWDNRCKRKEICVLTDPEDDRHFNRHIDGNEHKLYFKGVNRTYLLPLSSYRTVNVEVEKKITQKKLVLFGDLGPHDKGDQRLENLFYDDGEPWSRGIREVSGFADGKTTVEMRSNIGDTVKAGDVVNLFEQTNTQFSRVYLPPVDQKMVDEEAWLQIQIVTSHNQQIEINRSELNGRDRHPGHTSDNYRGLTMGISTFSMRLKATKFHPENGYNDFGWRVVEENKNYFKECIEDGHTSDWRNKYDD